MAGLCWMAVMLGMLLSAGSSLAVVDQNQLARIVTEVLNRYKPSYMGSNNRRRDPMFSLAVSIPYNSDKKIFDMSQVTDSADQVRDTILRCDVYSGTRVVAATVLRWPNVLDQCPDQSVPWSHVLRQCPRGTITWAHVRDKCPNAVRDGIADHAEYRTLQRFSTLTTHLNKNDLLLFFVISSPCNRKCTSQSSHWSILNSINEIMKWNNYAVAFSNVFKPRSGEDIPDTELRGAIERLGTHRGSLGSIGLNNIFRCNKYPMQCTSCSIGNQVNPYCYSDQEPGPSNLPSTRSDSPSQSGQGDGERKDINTGAGVSTNVDSSTGGAVGQGGGKGRRKRGRGKKGKKPNEGGGVSSSQSGLDVGNTGVDSSTGGMVGQGGSGKKGEKTNEDGGVSSSQSGLDVGNTGVVSSAGGVVGQDGGKGKRKRGRGKKGKKPNEGGGVSSSQSGLNADVDNNKGGSKGGIGRGKAKKVGGRRVAEKRAGGGNKQKSKSTEKKKKTQNKGGKQWGQEVQGKAKREKPENKSKQPQRRGGNMKRINQPLKKREMRW